MSGEAAIVAFHGCDVVTRDLLVRGQLDHLAHSDNQYDWLAPGAYFFEGDLERALLFATAACQHPEKRYTAVPIATHAAVGAVLKVTNWLDMTTQAGVREFSLAYQSLVAGLIASGAPVPQNRPAGEDDADIIYRALDSAVFTWLHSSRESQRPPLPPFQAVRAAFHQGPKVAPTSGFYVNTHIQIALRNDSCIVGWFLPRGARLLTDEQYIAAEARLRAAITRNKKPRVRL